MPKIRTVKPDFFKDEDLAELPFWVRILYEGLWVLADREGRLEERPKKIKAELFPYDKVDIVKGLELLAQTKPFSPTKTPFIKRYQVENDQYIQILAWHRHQRPHHTEAESKIPTMSLKEAKEAFPEKTSPTREPENNGEVTVNSPLTHGELTVSSPLTHGEYPEGKEGKGKERKGRVVGEPKQPSDPCAIEGAGSLAKKNGQKQSLWQKDPDFKKLLEKVQLTFDLKALLKMYEKSNHVFNLFWLQSMCETYLALTKLPDNLTAYFVELLESQINAPVPEATPPEIDPEMIPPG